jgi:hypothetical protein
LKPILCIPPIWTGTVHSTIEIGWFDHDGFALYRADNLASNDWNVVPGQEFEDYGEAALILRDPFPPNRNAFYRVTTP